MQKRVLIETPFSSRIGTLLRGCEGQAFAAGRNEFSVHHFSSFLLQCRQNETTGGGEAFHIRKQIRPALLKMVLLPRKGKAIFREASTASGNFRGHEPDFCEDHSGDHIAGKMNLEWVILQIVAEMIFALLDAHI